MTPATLPRRHARTQRFRCRRSIGRGRGPRDRGACATGTLSAAHVGRSGARRPYRGRACACGPVGEGLAWDRPRGIRQGARGVRRRTDIQRRSAGGADQSRESVRNSRRRGARDRRVPQGHRHRPDIRGGLRESGRSVPGPWRRERSGGYPAPGARARPQSGRAALRARARARPAETIRRSVEGIGRSGAARPLRAPAMLTSTRWGSTTAAGRPKRSRCSKRRGSVIRSTATCCPASPSISRERATATARWATQSNCRNWTRRIPNSRAW